MGPNAGANVLLRGPCLTITKAISPNKDLIYSVVGRSRVVGKTGPRRVVANNAMGVDLRRLGLATILGVVSGMDFSVVAEIYVVTIALVSRLTILAVVLTNEEGHGRYAMLGQD